MSSQVYNKYTVRHVFGEGPSVGIGQESFVKYVERHGSVHSVGYVERFLPVSMRETGHGRIGFVGGPWTISGMVIKLMP